MKQDNSYNQPLEFSNDIRLESKWAEVDFEEEVKESRPDISEDYEEEKFEEGIEEWPEVWSIISLWPSARKTPAAKKKIDYESAEDMSSSLIPPINTINSNTFVPN